MAGQVLDVIWPTTRPINAANGLVNAGYGGALGGVASSYLGMGYWPGIRVGVIGYAALAGGTYVYDLVQASPDDEGNYASKPKDLSSIGNAANNVASDAIDYLLKNAPKPPVVVQHRQEPRNYVPQRGYH